MTNAKALWVVLALWAAAMVASVLYLMAEPTGDGFTHGLNRLMGFLVAQLFGAILAFIAWLIAAPMPKGSVERWLGRIPGWWCVVLLLAIAATLAWACFSAQRASNPALPERPPVTTEVPTY